jgi:hypothetical protein
MSAISQFVESLSVVQRKTRLRVLARYKLGLPDEATEPEPEPEPERAPERRGPPEYRLRKKHKAGRLFARSGAI